MQKYYQKILYWILGIIGLTAVIYFEWPIASVFLNAAKPLGGDTSVYLYYVNYFKDHLVWPPLGWKAQQFEGIPQILDYAWLHFYLIQPLVSSVGVVGAVKIYPILYQFLLVVSSYLLFWRISKKPVLATLLTLGVIFSQALYIPLYNSGVVISSISQAYLPLTLFLLVVFLETKNKKYLLLGSVVTALALYTHVVGFLFVIVPATLLLLFWPDKFSQKMKFVLLYEIAVFSFGALAFLPPFLDRIFFGGFAGIQAIFESEKNLFQKLFASVNIYLLLASAVSVVLVLPLTLKRFNPLLTPLVVILVYYLLFMTTLWYGVNPLAGFIFPHRVYWVLPILLGCLIAVIFAARQPQSKILGILDKVLLIAVMGLLGVSLLRQDANFFGFLPKYELQRIRKSSSSEKISPEKLYTDADMSNLISRMSKDNTLFRMYTLEGGPNVFYGIADPQLNEARGVFHYMNNDSKNWFAWLDEVLAESIYTDKGTIYKDVAIKQGEYLLDWYAIKYLISGKNDVSEIGHHFFDKNNPCVAWTSNEAAPGQIEISDNCTSAYIRPTAVPVIGFIGGDFAYDVFVRDLGIMNFNSRYAIPVKLPNYLEDLTITDLDNFDGLLIYDYQKKGGLAEYEAAWKIIQEFVSQGGRVIVDTGATAPEKYASGLPEVFPIDKIYSGSLGRSWQVTLPGEAFHNIDFTQFAPLEYEGGDWTVSYTDSASVKTGAQVLLDLAGKPVIVSQRLGTGEIVWSGLNLPYRPMYLRDKAVVESQLLAELLKLKFAIANENPMSFNLERNKPGKITLSSSSGTGVLFKENNYGGWVAEVNGRRQPIYSAGPFFMYIRFPRELWNKPVTVKLIYRGVFSHWLFFLISVISGILILEYIVIDSKISKNLVRRLGINWLYGSIKSRITGVKSWWNKDENE